MRPELTAEAIRLARMLAELVPDEPEVHGLQALLELQASRLGARVDPAGNAVLLEDQDRALWDELLIRRGLSALATAEQLAASERPVGRYFLQAVIAAHHARADTAQEPDVGGRARRCDVRGRSTPGHDGGANRHNE